MECRHRPTYNGYGGLGGSAGTAAPRTGRARASQPAISFVRSGDLVLETQSPTRFVAEWGIFVFNDKQECVNLTGAESGIHPPMRGYLYSSALET
jgi:hypothetical protein